MESLFTWCAVIAGSLFAVQFVMLLLGLHGGNDLDLDHSHIDMTEADLDFDKHPDSFAHSDAWFVGIVTFRSLVAAVAVFGLAGLAAMRNLPSERAFMVAVLAGCGTLYLVGWGFKQLYQLQADGTVKLEDAVGCTGTVYLTIPGQHQGAGKVTVKVAGRTMEYRAMTNGESLPTGTPIVVASAISEDTLEVESQLPAEPITTNTQQNS